MFLARIIQKRSILEYIWSRWTWYGYFLPICTYYEVQEMFKLSSLSKKWDVAYSGARDLPFYNIVLLRFIHASMPNVGS